MSLKSLQSFIFRTKEIKIYNGNDIIIPQDAKEKPTLKSQEAECITLSVHAITAAQMDHVQTVRNSPVPPMITRVINGISNTEENTSDPTYLSNKDKADSLSVALVAYYGCDSIREDIKSILEKKEDNDSSHEYHAQHLLNLLPLTVVEDIAQHILNIKYPGLSADFFSVGSSNHTPS